MPSVNHDILLTLKEVAARLNVSVRTVNRYISDGTLPSIKIGGLRRVLEADLEEFIRKHRKSLIGRNCPLVSTC